MLGTWETYLLGVVHLINLDQADKAKSNYKFKQDKDKKERLPNQQILEDEDEIRIHANSV